MAGSAKPAGVKAAWVRLPSGQAEDGDSVPPATTVWCVVRACAAACPMANRLEPHWASSVAAPAVSQPVARLATLAILPPGPTVLDRKSTRLNSSHVAISYAVFCLKKKQKTKRNISHTTQ